MKNKIIDGIDYYWEENNGNRYRVFTEVYFLNRGFCCNGSCRHCPYNKNDKKNINTTNNGVDK